jgi:hypothetical protein
MWQTLKVIAEKDQQIATLTGLLARRNADIGMDPIISTIGLDPEALARLAALEVSWLFLRHLMCSLLLLPSSVHTL